MKSLTAKTQTRPPLQAMMYWVMVASIWIAIFAVGFVAAFSLDLPDTSSLDHAQRQPSITYLDRSGALLATRGSQTVQIITLEQLPPYVPAAFIAIEDRKFYHHPGFDPLGMMRAISRNLFRKKGSNLAGGSTITQQLARNLFLSRDQNLKRKAQELILSLWLEHKYSKKQILELYLNHVDFGAGATGIEAASLRYFNKSAKNLTIGEAALLAGLMKGPSRYSPISNNERAAGRATVVLNEMVRANVITATQRDEAMANPVKVTRTLASAHALYFIDWLDNQVRSIVGEGNKDDLVVETTLDLTIQGDAERAVQMGLQRDANRGAQQAALVAVDGEGRIRAMIGGSNYADTPFNRAVDAHRQAGSSFKPFVYLTAMEAGYTPDTPVVDEPVTINGWSPENYTKKFLGPIDLKTAVRESVNTVAARVADVVGRDKVAATAHRLGVESNLNTDPAMALGAVEVTPLEMAQAYIPFSNGGIREKAHGLLRIKTTSGKTVYEYREDSRVQVINNPPLSEMALMLRGVVQAGSGKGAEIPGYDIAGKTGTTSDYRDAWFDGFTGGFVTVVWVGKDNNTPMNKIVGGITPAYIWHNFMATTLKRIKVSTIPAGPPAPVSAEAQSALSDLMGGSSGSASSQTEGPDTTTETQSSASKEKTADDIFSAAQHGTDGH